MGLGNSKAAVSVPVIRPALDQTEVPDSRETEPDDSSSTVHASKEAATTNSGCPMHRGNGTYSYDWRALLRAGFPHGPGGSTPLTKEDAQSKVVATDASSVSPSVPEATVPTSVSSGCPVQQPLSSSSSSSKQPGGCPVKQRPEYNVYAQPIDPTNQMPSNPNQLPAPTQSALLSTKRVVSSIPKGGAAAEGSTWTYPSPQMFYNALARKGKLADTVEEDIESVVALHNNMNEKTWKKVLEWEKTVCRSEEAPKLLQFQGRPTDLSPKAAFKHYALGHPLPYDRHDWTVERQDGTTVRYVIDYYHDESRARDDPESALPDIHNAAASSSLLVDVRPAADGPVNIWNRVVTMPYARHVAGNASFKPLPMLPTATMKSQVKESVAVWQSIQAAANQRTPDVTLLSNVSEATAIELAQSFATMLTNCRKAQAAVDQCETEAGCARASIDLSLCLGKSLCPLQHEALVQRLNANDDDAIDDALSRVNDCVALKTHQHAILKETYPEVFQERGFIHNMNTNKK